MLVSEKWIREWVDTDERLDRIAYDLTQAGLEVEGIIQPEVAHLERIVVGDILEAVKHPNADRLKLCTVSDGKNTYEIVCGAPNARSGMKVALARVNTVLPGNFKIKEAKIRGALSQGMLCSAKELGIGEDHQGIIELPADAKPGDSLLGYISVPAATLDIAITPNRGDCLSIQGVARDLAAIYNLPLNRPQLKKIKAEHKDELSIELVDPVGCPRYLGRIIKGVDMTVPTPDWMKEHLVAVGIKPISIAVDITNYVMMELGQPLHAFDLRQLKGGIRVRRAAKDEKLVLLDESELNLDEEDLVIADHKKALALAGVMGGKHSGIAEDTKDVFLEAAFFSPGIIFGKQQKYNIGTDAAYRFERHTDPEMPRIAMERATEQLLEIAGGTAGPITETVDKSHLPKQRTIKLEQKFIADFLGFDKNYYIKDEEIERILRALGMILKMVTAGEKGNNSPQKSNVWQVTMPSFRPDIDCAAALGEELARVFGYDEVPITLPLAEAEPRLANQQVRSDDQARDLLSARGFYEVINYSFISAEDVQRFYPEKTNESLPIANPISADMAIMRPGLLPGMLRNLIYNHRRRMDDNKLKIFEVGNCFTPDEKTNKIVDSNHLGMAIIQPIKLRLWRNRPYDFSWLLQDISSLLSMWRMEERVEIVYDYPDDERGGVFHPRRRFALRDKAVKGEISTFGGGGMLHPQHLEDYKLKDYSVYYFSCDMDRLPPPKSVRFHKFSLLPLAYLEISLEVSTKKNYSQVAECVRRAGGTQLVDIKLLDIYQSADMRKSGSQSFTLLLSWESDSESLTDEDVNHLMAEMLKKLSKDDIKLRS